VYVPLTRFFAAITSIPFHLFLASVRVPSGVVSGTLKALQIFCTSPPRVERSRERGRGETVREVQEIGFAG